VRRHVFGNPWIWVLCIANFFVYTVRYSVLDWGPTLLNEAKGVKVSTAGWMMAAFEGSGLLGMLVAGWVTDRVFGGRGARTCLVWMLGCIGATVLLWRYPGRSVAVYTGILCLAGFFIYGPQALVGIHAANLATKRAAATAIGFTGLFGYASTVLSGVGLGMLTVEGQNLVLAGALITIALNSAFFALLDPLQDYLRKHSALARKLESREDPLAQLPWSTEERGTRRKSE